MRRARRHIASWNGRAARWVPLSAADLCAIGIRDEEYRTIGTGPHSITQRWARRIEAFPGLDGLHYNSRFAGQPCIALFSPASYFDLKKSVG